MPCYVEGPHLIRDPAAVTFNAVACDHVPVESSLTPVLSSPGWELLAALESLPGRRHMDALKLGTILRNQGLEPDVAAGVLAQLSLRDHAESKFGPFARHMVFTRDGLEQATRMIVAARHAQRFRDSGAQRVADLGSGIGGDSLALAGLGLGVIAVDKDPDAAAAAAANLRAFPQAEVRLSDVMDLDVTELAAEGVDGIFADPARRTGATKGSSRVLGPEQWSPPLSQVLSWRNTIERVGVKMAPGVPHTALPGECHVQWTSVDSDLVEAALWTPILAPEGPGRSALVIREGDAHTLSDPELRAANAPVIHAEVGELGRIVAEPDSAVIRSGLVKALAEHLGTHLISEGIAWLSADSIDPTPFASRFEVIDVVPLRSKDISRALTTLDVGRVEVKKRGADIDPATLRSSLRVDGSQEATVIATRIRGRHRAIIARRIPPDTSAGMLAPPSSMKNL